MEWCDEHEDLLKEWAEKARFYSWLHHATSAEYGKLNNMLTIPMMILSIIDGSANFTMVGKTSNSFLYITIFPIMLGSFSIITAVLSAMTKYLKTAELTEKHELFYRQFNVLVRNITQELSIPPDQRKVPSEALNMNRYEFDRLENEAPRIPEHVVAEFNKRFPYKKNKPEIANAFSKIRIHGREQNIKKRLDEFQRIRLFYKWKSAKFFQDTKRHQRDTRISIGDLHFVETPTYMNYNTSFAGNGNDSFAENDTPTQRVVNLEIDESPSPQSEIDQERDGSLEATSPVGNAV